MATALAITSFAFAAQTAFCTAGPPGLLGDLHDQLTESPDLIDLLRRAIIDDPPLVIKEGGIIRDGFDAALDELRAHRARWALLNVRPNNPGAIDLYKGFGFEEMEMRGDWMRLPPFHRSTIGELGGAQIRPLRWSDRKAVVELMRAVVPDKISKLRKQELHPYWLNWEDRLTEPPHEDLTALLGCLSSDRSLNVPLPKFTERKLPRQTV